MSREKEPPIPPSTPPAASDGFPTEEDLDTIASLAVALRDPRLSEETRQSLVRDLLDEAKGRGADPDELLELARASLTDPRRSRGTLAATSLQRDLWDLIERRWEAREYERKDKTTALSEFVFHAGDGQAVTDFKHSWATACKKAGCAGKLFHDLRRTAVRDMIRAGVPQSVAMRISGHKTAAIFLRYDITSEDDKREALRKTQEHRKAQPSGSPKVEAGNFGAAKTGTE